MSGIACDGPRFQLSSMTTQCTSNKGTNFGATTMKWNMKYIRRCETPTLTMGRGFSLGLQPWTVFALCGMRKQERCCTRLEKVPYQTGHVWFPACFGCDSSCYQWSFFSKLNQIFLDTLILKIYFLIMKINNFQGDLSSISAKTATLLVTSFHVSFHALQFWVVYTHVAIVGMCWLMCWISSPEVHWNVCISHLV